MVAASVACSHSHTGIVYQNPPLEKPPGGTRDRLLPASDCGGGAAALPLPFDAGAAAADFGPASAGAEAAGADAVGFDTTSCFVCSTTLMFGSTVFMQKFKFDEFCWSYLGRGLGTCASGAPPAKMLVCPPPGGFKTRLELRSPLIPMLNSVEVILLLLLLLLLGYFFNQSVLWWPLASLQSHARTTVNT